MTVIVFLILSNALTDLVFGRYLERLVRKYLRSFLRVSKFKNAFNRLEMFNPETLLKFLATLPKAEIAAILKEVENAKVRSASKRGIDKFITQSGKPMTQAEIKQGTNHNQAERQFMQAQEKQRGRLGGVTGGDGKSESWRTLSSSWLKRGHYIPNGPATGTLTIMVNSDKTPGKWYGPYTYNQVRIETWEAMTQARGKNGTGAGSVFWKDFLHHWMPSKLRKYVHERLGYKEGEAYQGKQHSKEQPLNNQEILAFRNQLKLFKGDYLQEQRKEREQKRLAKEHLAGLKRIGLVDAQGAPTKFFKEHNEKRGKKDKWL